MCGKAAVSHLSWAEIYAYASSLTAPKALPANPESRINISPSRLRRKSEPDSMVWETLPVIYRAQEENEDADTPCEAIDWRCPIIQHRPDGVEFTQLYTFCWVFPVE